MNERKFCPICSKVVEDIDRHLDERHHYGSNNLAHLGKDRRTDQHWISKEVDREL